MFSKYFSPKFILGFLASGFIGIGFIMLIGFLLTGFNYITLDALPRPIVVGTKPSGSDVYYSFKSNNCSIAKIYSDGKNYDPGNTNGVSINPNNYQDNISINFACMTKIGPITTMSTKRVKVTIDKLKSEVKMEDVN